MNQKKDKRPGRSRKADFRRTWQRGWSLADRIMRNDTAAKFHRPLVEVLEDRRLLASAAVLNNDLGWQPQGPAPTLGGQPENIPDSPVVGQAWSSSGCSVRPARAIIVAE